MLWDRRIPDASIYRNVILFSALACGCAGKTPVDPKHQPEPCPAPTITVWLTRDALRKGIEERHVADPRPDEQITVTSSEGCTTYFLHYQPGEWHRTREAAVVRAEQMRNGRVTEMKEELRALEGMKF